MNNQKDATTNTTEIRLARRSPTYWRVRGFHKPGDVEERLGSYVGQLGR